MAAAKTRSPASWTTTLSSWQAASSCGVGGLWRLGERVIQLPGVLRPTSDPLISPDPRDWRVQLLVGQTAMVDCNLHSFGARLRAQVLPDGKGVLYRVSNVSPLLSTRMACPGRKPEQRFVTMAGKPYVVPYNASFPIVVDAPAPLELRWRLWKAETTSEPAQLVR